MEILVKDNWMGKMLNHPSNACVFAWGILWRLAAAIIASALVVGYVWVWCLAFHDGFISGHHQAPAAIAVWLLMWMTIIAVVAIFAAKDYWWNNRFVKQLRAAVRNVCPTIVWDKG